MKTIFTLLLAAVGLTLATPSFADTLVNTNAKQFQLDHSATAGPRVKIGTIELKRREHSLKCVYDFAKQGGAVSSINLLDEDGKNCVIPSKAIIRDVIIDVITTPTSGGSATIALTAQSAGDLKAALAFGSWTGIVAGIPVGTAATAIKMTADRSPVATIAVAALTAGKLNVQIKYQLSE